jgi:hypothetical protein
MNEFNFLNEMGAAELLDLYGMVKSRLTCSPAAADYVWPEIRDPRDQRDAPPFPINRLPIVMRTYCMEASKGSGFDSGACAFCALVAVASMIDHRARMQVGPFSVPPFLWGGVVDPSSGGKSPILKTACRFVHEVNHKLLESSRTRSNMWQEDCKQIKNKKDYPNQPPWNQLIVEDITVEALGDLLLDNPSGLFYLTEEFTEFIGRMDAYSTGGKGGSKDRGAYLRAWDANSHTINRVGKGNLYIENFSLGLLAGIQPGKLAEMYRRSETQSDGLFQRFLMYKIAPPKDADYNERMPFDVADQFRELCLSIHRKTESGAFLGERYRLSEDASQKMEKFHNDIRGYCLNASAGDRIKEHLGKYPGIVGRIAFALHVMHHCGTERVPEVVSLETYLDAEQIAKVLMQHAFSIHEGIESTVSKSAHLVDTACEAILAKGWHDFTRSDLTREATHWRKCEEQEAEHAINTLVDFGWITDETMIKNALGVGRRAKGAYKVNPKVHLEYAEKAQEIVLKRHMAYQKIDSLLPLDE